MDEKVIWVSFKTKYFATPIRYRTKEPNYSHLPEQEHDWSRTVYGNVKEEILKDIPKLLGSRVTTATFLDANLHHDIVTGRSVTAVLLFINTTPIDWYSKRQVTVETAMYGSEFVAGKAATEQIMDLRNTLRYLGAPIITKRHICLVTRSQLSQATIPQSVLNKRHKMLSYHRVREAIAAKILDFYCCASDQNKSHILGKHWEHAKSRTQ